MRTKTIPDGIYIATTFYRIVKLAIVYKVILAIIQHACEDALFPCVECWFDI